MPTAYPLKIISGAQTGVDRAALDVAMQLGFECGGWCPAGRLDEQGVIPARYPVTELEKGGFLKRTVQNLLDADGTMILYFGYLEGGTENTVFHCIKNRRPYCLVQASEVRPQRAAELAHAFVTGRKIAKLNVAGPRASKCPEAYDYTVALMRSLLSRLAAGG